MFVARTTDVRRERAVLGDHPHGPTVADLGHPRALDHVDAVRARLLLEDPEHLHGIELQLAVQPDSAPWSRTGAAARPATPPRALPRERRPPLAGPHGVRTRSWRRCTPAGTGSRRHGRRRTGPARPGPRRSPRRTSATVSAGCRRAIRDSWVPWSRLTFAVLPPVVPSPIRRASSRVTALPARPSRTASVRPVMPPPTIATSVVPSTVEAAGGSGRGCRSCQSETRVICAGPRRRGR